MLHIAQWLQHWQRNYQDTAQITVFVCVRWMLSYGEPQIRHASGSAQVNRTGSAAGGLMLLFYTRDPADMTQWSEEDVHIVVDAFLEVRFPTILLLNKADQGGDSDRNIERIVNKYDAERCFVARSVLFGGDADDVCCCCLHALTRACFSAAAELFLKQASRKNLIVYKPGDSTFMTKADVTDELEFVRMRGEPVPPELEQSLQTLEEPEQKVSSRLVVSLSRLCLPHQLLR